MDNIVHKFDNYLIDGEQAYPIYSISVSWIERCSCGKENCYCCKEHAKGIADYKNGTSFTEMHRNMQYLNDIERIYKNQYSIDFIKEKWERSRIKEIIEPPIIKVVFRNYETWCIGWFYHWTFNNGQSNTEVIESFDKFVERKRYFNSRNEEGKEFIDEKGNKYSNRTEPYCLMGAEDRWRWTGEQIKGEKSSPPCRCEYCEKKGVISINH